MVHLIILNKKDYSMSLFPQGTATYSRSMVCTQTRLSINMGRELNERPDSDANSTNARAAADWNESRSPADNGDRHLQYPPLKDSCGTRKLLPSPTNSCSSLEPHRIFVPVNSEPSHSPVLHCWSLPLQASGNQGKNPCICRQQLWEGLFLLKDPFLWYSCLLFPFKFLYCSGIALCLIYSSSRGWQPFVSLGVLDGASGRECLSILSHQAWENGSCPHTCEKKDIILRKPNTN